jgi:hypothetical protein
MFADPLSGRDGKSCAIGVAAIVFPMARARSSYIVSRALWSTADETHGRDPSTVCCEIGSGLAVGMAV